MLAVLGLTGALTDVRDIRVARAHAAQDFRSSTMVEPVHLHSDKAPASAGAASQVEEIEATASVEIATAETVGTEMSKADEEPRTQLDELVRDYALLHVYALGVSIDTAARAVGVTPGDAFATLARHLLGEECAGDAPVVDDGDLDSVPDLYMGGMTPAEMAEALGYSVRDIAWALLEGRPRVVPVTHIVLRSLRSKLEPLTNAYSSS